MDKLDHEAIANAWKHASGEADKENEINSYKRQIAEAQLEYDSTGDPYWTDEIAKLRDMLAFAEGKEIKW